MEIDLVILFLDVLVILLANFGLLMARAKWHINLKDSLNVLSLLSVIIPFLIGLIRFMTYDYMNFETIIPFFLTLFINFVVIPALNLVVTQIFKEFAKTHYRY